MISVSVGVRLKSEENEEVEDVAALRRMCGRGETVRSEGSAATREFGGGDEDVITRTIGHGLESSLRHEDGPDGSRQLKIKPQINVDPATPISRSGHK